MLDLDLSTIFWEIVNFLVLTVILYFLVFKPMTKRAEQRAVEKAETREALKKDREEAAVKLQEIDERLLNLEDEIQRITDEAYENSQILQRDLLEATRVEANQIMMDAVNESRKEQEVDIKRMQVDLVDTVMHLVNDSLQEVTPPVAHDKLIEEMTSTIWSMGKNDMSLVQNIRESLAERIPTVEVFVPRELSAEQQIKLLNTFNALADKEVELEVTVQPELVAGIKARIGDIVMDNSVQAHLDKVRDDVSLTLETMVTPEDD